MCCLSACHTRHTKIVLKFVTSLQSQNVQTLKTHSRNQRERGRRHAHTTRHTQQQQSSKGRTQAKARSRNARGRYRYFCRRQHAGGLPDSKKTGALTSVGFWLFVLGCCGVARCISRNPSVYLLLEVGSSFNNSSIATWQILVPTVRGRER